MKKARRELNKKLVPHKKNIKIFLQTHVTPLHEVLTISVIWQKTGGETRLKLALPNNTYSFLLKTPLSFDLVDYDLPNCVTFPQTAT